MNKKQFVTLLGSLSGHLVTASPQQEEEIQNLHQSLSRSLLPEDVQQLKASSFTFENADLFSLEQIPAERSAALNAIAEQQAATSAEPEFRVFVREVPVRSALLHASVPPWASGAAVDQTLGPFTNKDGRQFWFDFYRIEKLVALYIQGSPNPVLLFNEPSGPRFIDLTHSQAANLLRAYHLPAGSIWIYSQILAANAPAGTFTGLTIKGGTITLSAPPQLANGKLTLAANTIVTVGLQLQQSVVQDADPSSPYGVDARQAALQLPQQFRFHFSAQGATLDEVSSAQWQVYGQESAFRWNHQAQPTYETLLQHVLIPLMSSSPTFQVLDCQSPFHQLQGQAPITDSAWALPVASIDILYPTPAAGIGALMAKCSSGLTAEWSGLKGGRLNLNQPYLFAEPGHLSLADFTAGNVFCQQAFNLWKDEHNLFGASIQVQYPQAGLFFYHTFANGNEVLMTLANADVQIDRPVTVAGQALAIHSKNSILLLAVNKVLKLIYLFDDNILFDNTDLSQKPPVIPEPIALALHNALFKVTPVNGCFLVGQLADDFVKVERGFLFLTFGLYAYLPTLPDPYAANIGSLKSQFRGAGVAFAANNIATGGTVWMWLVSQAQWQPGTEGNDRVAVSFHFAPLQNQFQILQGPAPAVAQPGSENSLLSSEVAQPSLCETILTPRQDDQQAISAVESIVEQPQAAGLFTAEMAFSQYQPDYHGQWDEQTGCLQQDLFALLDVSTNADLLGVSFNVFGSERMAMVRTFRVTPGAAAFPLQVEGMDVVSSGNNVRAFTLPEISWEPVLNTALHVLPGDPPGY